MTLLPEDLEHMVNDKYQLFLDLKVLGILVATRDLYCWRRSAEKLGKE
jgi:hypothetical protein